LGHGRQNSNHRRQFRDGRAAAIAYAREGAYVAINYNASGPRGAQLRVDQGRPASCCPAYERDELAPARVGGVTKRTSDSKSPVVRSLSQGISAAT